MEIVVVAMLREYTQLRHGASGGWNRGSAPARGDKLFKDGKEVGHLTSAIKSPKLNANIALGYVRREVNAAETKLTLRSTVDSNDKESICSISPYWPCSSYAQS